MEELNYVAVLDRHDMLPNNLSSADYSKFARNTVVRQKALIDKLDLAKLG